MLSKRGKCTLSDEIFRNLTVLGAVGKKEMSFVGDFSPVVSGSGTGLVEWAPDELRAETEGDIMVKYVDEVEPAVSKRDEVESVVSKQDELKSVVSKLRFFGQWLFRTHS